MRRKVQELELETTRLVVKLWMAVHKELALRPVLKQEPAAVKALGDVPVKTGLQLVGVQGVLLLLPAATTWSARRMSPSTHGACVLVS